jgi:hypothetical protein
MWESLKNLGNSLKSGVKAVYNKVKPTLESIKATATEAWELVKDLGQTLKHSFGFGKSSIQLAEQLIKAAYKGIKGLTWDIAQEFSVVEEVSAAPNTPAAKLNASAAAEASQQTRTDLSEAWSHATNAYQHSGEALFNASNTLYYSGSAVYHTATTLFYTGKTAYNALNLGASCIKGSAESAVAGAKWAAANAGYVDFKPSVIEAPVAFRLAASAA